MTLYVLQITRNSCYNIYNERARPKQKKEFNRQLDFLRQQVKDTPETNECPVTEAEPITKEYTGHTTTVYIFRSGTVATYLTAKICKDGYQFKKQ